MKISLVRIDDRFIHGQILEAWIPHLRAGCVIVANDCLACDQFQKTIMSLAIPDKIVLRIVRVDEVPDLDEDVDIDGKPTLLIVSSVRDAHRLQELGVRFKHLNIGNMRSQDGFRQLSYSAWINDLDVSFLRSLWKKGIAISLQSVPREREVDIRTLVEM